MTAVDPPAGDDAVDDASLVSEWASVVRAVDAVQHVFAARLESIGMSLPYFAVLRLLIDANDQRLPMSRIARDLAMTSGGFTKLADRMARDGLIDRRGSSGDRRVVFAALTDAGRDQAHRAVRAYHDFLTDEVLALLSREDLSTLASISRRLDALGTDADADVPNFELTLPAANQPERRHRESRDGRDG